MKVLISASGCQARATVSAFDARGVQYKLCAPGELCADVADYDCYVVMARDDAEPYTADCEALAVIESIARARGAERNRVDCHAVFASQTTVDMICRNGIAGDIETCLRVYPATSAELWGRRLFGSPSKHDTGFPQLDYEPLVGGTERHVHLVIVGAGSMAYTLARIAALTAHYPGYVVDSSCRTRITVADADAAAVARRFVAANRNLMPHSWWRVIDLDGRRCVAANRPIYDGRRDDFIDVEWEFVATDLMSGDLNVYLSRWASDPQQLLTVVLADDDDGRNMQLLDMLPAEVAEAGVPVAVRLNDDRVLRMTGAPARVMAFGGGVPPINLHAPEIEMGKMLNHVYECIFAGNGLPAELDSAAVEADWNRLKSYNMMHANIYNALTFATKMRSLGHCESDWDNFYALDADEIKLLGAVEHNRWSVERLLSGMTPPDDKQREAIATDIAARAAAAAAGNPQSSPSLKKEWKRRGVHYDLCSFDELGVDENGKDMRRFDYMMTECIPLIVNTYRKRYGDNI